jgi:hypothetical protein
MLISSESGGGEIVSSSDETRFYDDIGCLAADWIEHQDRGRAFVRIAAGRWSDAQTASYARPNEVRTAMGSGFAAFSTVAEARAVDREHRALTFDDVIRLAGGPR